ncbi:hypothetical protein RCL1_005425 [Eukaryota sp. TZLM3-RCL]
MLDSELRSAIFTALDSSGALERFRAAIRSEVLSHLKNEHPNIPETIPENQIVNALILEYLNYNHYNATAAVFLPETSHKQEDFPRSMLAQHFHLPDDVRKSKLPILYSLIAQPPME